MNENETVVWSRFARFLHWSIAIAFVTLISTGFLHMIDLHKPVGLATLVLIIMRIIYGFKTRGYNRFSAMLYTPAQSFRYLVSIVKGNPEKFTGHNPLASPVMLGIIWGIFINALSGVTMAVLENMTDSDPTNEQYIATAESIETIHESISIFIAVLVALHFIGLIVHTIVHKENIAKSMITGKK